MALKRRITKTLSAACAMVALSGQAYGLDIWHSNTVGLSRGICAASFTLDSGGAWGDHIQNLRIALAAVDTKTNSPVAQVVLEVDDFGRDNASRYKTVYWENELVCEENVRLVITEADAIVAGQARDLLADGYLNIREFVPYRIDIDANFPNASERPQACQAPKFTATAVIQDKDGYSNVRAQPNAKSNVIEKLFDNEPFYTFEQKGNWWQVCTPTGQVGYLYHDRIRM
ncbi:IrmA family protein [Paenalcaligenes faecalis]|uniref:IrmA family protein n=1 Tax=Paenalcaligenes faecalis TaxID=2980099 RepID=UPI0022B95726|nr:IrmA family protein [Paenalcaligenes faecalis]